MQKLYMPYVCLNIPFIGVNHYPVTPSVCFDTPSVCKTQNIRGFTLIELMVTLLVLAILSAIAYPSYQNLILNTRIRTVTGDITTTLHLARSEAIKQKLPVFVCVSNDGASCTGSNWASGIILWSDQNNNAAIDAGEVLRVLPATPGNITVTFTTAGTTSLQFGSMGTSNVAGSFQICDSVRTGETGKEIQITAIGRPSTIDLSCP